MKINFHKNDSGFRYKKEKAGPKKKRNLDRIIYLTLLSLLLLFVGKYAFYKLFYATADGLILMDKLEISNINDSRILKFYVSEGDSISIGDTLFTYTEKIYAEGNVNFQSDEILIKPKEWIDKEIYNLTKDIALKNIEIQELNKRISVLSDHLEKCKNAVILDVMTKSRLESIQEKIITLKYNKSILYSEIQYLKQYLNTLQSQNTETSITGTGFNTLYNEGKKAFMSPIDNSSVTSIKKTEFEVALKSEIILDIHCLSEIYIKAFFKQSDLRFIKPGDEVEIEFPDGTTSYGIIKNFYYATYKLPEEFQKKYESITRSLAVDIIPISDEEKKKWNFFYKLSVKVRKKKFNIF